MASTSWATISAGPGGGSRYEGRGFDSIRLGETGDMGGCVSCETMRAGDRERVGFAGRKGGWLFASDPAQLRPGVGRSSGRLSSWICLSDIFLSGTRVFFICLCLPCVAAACREMRQAPADCCIVPRGHSSLLAMLFAQHDVSGRSSSMLLDRHVHLARSSGGGCTSTCLSAFSFGPRYCFAACYMSCSTVRRSLVRGQVRCGD